MTKLKVNDFLPDLRAETSRGPASFSQLVAGQKTVFLFLRYAGCRVCQYDMMALAAEYGQIEKAGGQVYVALQSSLETVAELLRTSGYPFAVISDEPGRLYRALGIDSASSAEQLVSPQSREKVDKAAACGFVHGKNEGDELQLPATIITDGSMRIQYLRYGTRSGDTPSPEELVQMLSQSQNSGE